MRKLLHCQIFILIDRLHLLYLTDFPKFFCSIIIIVITAELWFDGAERALVASVRHQI